MSINKCPLGNLQSFPVKAGFTVTDTTFTKAKEKPMNIQFNWGTRTTAPNFSYANSGIFDHTQNDYLTTLMYNGVLYTLASGQLTKPSHNNWLRPETLEVGKLDNVEDIMLTFQRDMYTPISSTDPAIIILVNPILRNRSQNGNPLYLANFGNQVASPVTLESVFPWITSNSYAYYTTCVNGLTSRDPYKNILVLLNLSGMMVSTELMTKIKDMYNKFSEGDYPEYVPPGNFRTQSNPNDTIKSVREGFQTATQTSPVSSDSDTNGSSQGYKVEQCFRFDPEMVRADGTIVLDAAGKPLKDIQNSRDANKKIWLGTMSSPGSVSLTDVEKGIVYSFVALCIFAIIFVGGLAFLYTNQDTGIYNRVLPGARSIGYLSVQGLALFIFGFGIGMSAFPATCPSSNCNDVKNVPLIVSAVLIGLLFIYSIYIVFRR
jgi:hypothetical protein